MTIDPKTLIPFWINEEEPLAWDTLFIDGDFAPGIATITGKGLKRKLDKKKPKGSDKASLKDEGEELAEVTIELLVFNDTDWKLLQGLMKKITPRKKGGLRAPLRVSHPILRLLNIDKIYVDSIPVPTIDKRNQFFSFIFNAVEWVPRPTPARRAAGAGGSNQTDESFEDLEKLLDDKLQDLANGSPVANAARDVMDVANNLLNTFSNLGSS